MHNTPVRERGILILLVLPLAIPLFQAIAMIAGHAGGVMWPWTITGSLFGRTLLFQGFVLLALVAYVFLVFRDARYQPFLTRTHGWFLVLFAVLVLTALVGHDLRFSIWNDTERVEGVLFLAHVGAYCFLLSWVIRDATRLRWFFHTATMLAVATLALLTIDAMQQHHHLLRVGTWRLQAQALLGNPNMFAHWLLLVLVAHVFTLLHPIETKPTRKAMHWLIAAILLGYLGSVVSSTALGLAIILLVYVGWRTHRSATYGVILAALLGVVGFVLLRSPHALDGPVQDLWNSLTIRRQIWTSGAATVLAHQPLAGYGWGNVELLWNDLEYDVFAAAYSPYTQSRIDRMHNLPLELLAAGGIIALIAGAIAWGRLLLRTFRRAWGERSRALEHTAVACTTILTYLLWNFDSLMGYVLTSALLVSAIIALDEPRLRIPLPPRRMTHHVIRIGIAAGSAVALLILVVQPLRASASLLHATSLLTASTEQRTDHHVPAILETLEHALLVRHPYAMHARDILDVMAQLVSRRMLTDAQQDALSPTMRTITEQLIAHHPLNPNLTHRKAWVHGQLRNASEEIAALETTVARAPTNGPFRFQLAHAYLRAKRHDDARVLVEAFLREGIFTTPATFLLGILDIWQGDVAGGRHRTAQALIAYTPTALEWRRLTEAQRASGVSDADIVAWYTRLYRAVPEITRDGLERAIAAVQPPPS